MNTIKDKWWFR